MEELKNLVGCGDSQVEARAKAALELTEMHEAGDLTVSEYKELMGDIARTAEIEDHAADVQMKSMLIKGIATATSLL